jgi:hypothetical protein
MRLGVPVFTLIGGLAGTGGTFMVPAGGVMPFVAALFPFTPLVPLIPLLFWLLGFAGFGVGLICVCADNWKELQIMMMGIRFFILKICADKSAVTSYFYKSKDAYR